MGYGLFLQVNHDILLVVLVLLCLPSAWLAWLVAQHCRLRRRGLAREARLLGQDLPPDSALPHVLVQVPAYNEPRVIGRIIEAVGRLDWPRDKLHIQVLDDSTDATTAIAQEGVAVLRARGIDAVLLHRADRRDFKAGALRDGLRLSDHPFVALFDVDFLPAADFLRQCLRALLADDGLAFVQTRWDCINPGASALTRAQQFILDAHFAVEETAKSWSGHVTHFAGSCGVWRRAAIDDAGGWSADTLVEDVDLCYRAQLRGWRAMLLVTVSVPGELPNTIAVWRAQQSRWTKGFGQLIRKHLVAIWRSKLTASRRLVATANLLVVGFGPLLAIALVTGAIELFVAGPSALALALTGFAIVFGFTAALVMKMLGQRMLRDIGFWSAMPQVISAMSFFVYAQLSAARGVLDGIRGIASPFVRTPKIGEPSDRPVTHA
ncbi:MAG TPA: glycosyltransferase [Stellaceae bacterium]|nr:glycosyltransferase [Stellaceae bacterium]